MAMLQTARPNTARREALWLAALDYMSVREIAAAAGVSVRRVQYGLRRARESGLDLKTVWDIEWIANPNAFTAGNQCEFHGGPGVPIPREFPIGCLRCLVSGLDHLIHATGYRKQVTTSEYQPNGVPKFKPKGKPDE